MDAAEKLRDLLAKDIDRFDIESSKHKRIHRRSQGFLIILTAATTVAAGLGLVFPNRVKDIQFLVLALSAVATGATAWTEMRRARDLWQHEREVFYALKDILRELDFRSSVRTLELAEVDELFQRTTSVLGASTAKWSRIQEKKLERK
ncbi:MAG TPA: DUF4231 domain-containing protein [Thermoanaerobaculia bacterium]|nr:DUF4231 domain-containing protein [Thermoanaerobaculia bacterium]